MRGIGSSSIHLICKLSFLTMAHHFSANGTLLPVRAAVNRVTICASSAVFPDVLKAAGVKSE
jgi:hypothetical protein